jgi:phenylpropionate dioxygenase-like ring-hydroxylating dioxygenase large terminal subunit
MTFLADDATVIQRIFDHIDRDTTDECDRVWREPVENYRSPARLAAELRLLRRHATPFCPSAALPEPGSYLTRDAAGTPLVAVRGKDGRARVFRNACRHRGTKLADGVGCTKVLECRYHGWTYDLDGALRYVPDVEGFPGLDRAAHGLVAVHAVEHRGLVFVTQEEPRIDARLDELPPLLSRDLRLLSATEMELPVNWKIFVEGFLEGYHIRSTHPQTFYPVQYDNVNVVERFGRNNRIVFPYRAIEKLRGLPPSEWRPEAKLTYVYHLFPNAIVATFPAMTIFAVIEPVAIDRSRFRTWRFTDRAEADPASRERVDRGSSFVDAGAAEDRDVACAVQQGLASGANEFLEFGRFEGAIVHFHETLHELLDS